MMHVIILATLCAAVLGKGSGSVETANEQLRRTNSILLKTLQNLEHAVGAQHGIEKALAEPRFCAENHDCPGGVCLFGKCKDLFPEGAVCADDRDCASGRCSWNVCLQGKSVPEGAVCADDSDCASGRCSWNVCLQGEKAVGEVDCDTVRKCQVCTDADHDHKCIWMNSDCYVLEEVQDRWFAREDYNDVFAVHADECPAGLDSLSDEDWCERRQRAGAYIYGSNPPTREYVPCEPFDVEKCPNLCAELAANGMKPVPDACWHYSSAGVDLAPGEWDGYDRTNVHDCVNRAESAGVHLFAWTGEVYSGYCKVLKKSVTKPNLDTNQGYGYRLFGNTCGSSATSAGIRAEKMVAGETVQGDVTYIYRDGESYIFMNLDTYEEIAVNSKVVGENKHWLVENKSYKLTLSNGNPIAVTPPNFLELEVVETAPGSTGGKSATLSTGAVVWVPLFIHNGDVVKVDTRTASYVSLV